MKHLLSRLYGLTLGPAVALALAHVLTRTRDRDFARDFARALAHALADALTRDRDFALDFALDFASDYDLARALANDRNLAFNLQARVLAHAGAFAHDRDLARDFARDFARAQARAIAHPGDLASARILVRATAYNPGLALAFLGASVRAIGPAWRHREATTSQPRAVLTPPGTRLRHILALLYPAKTYDRIFVETLDDTLDEWTDAMIAGHDSHARWIQIRGYLDLARTIALHSFASAARLLVEVFKLAGG